MEMLFTAAVLYLLGLGGVCAGVVGLNVAGRKKRIENAYKWNKPNVHGQRKFASDKELKKAGLL